MGPDYSKVGKVQSSLKYVNMYSRRQKIISWLSLETGQEGIVLSYKLFLNTFLEIGKWCGFFNVWGVIH